MKKVSELMEERNLLDAQILSIKKGITDKNTVVLIKEVMNLLDGVSNAYISKDYYATNRLYSDIEGVKNIRFSGIDDSKITVKVTSPAGYLLPDKIEVRKISYPIVFWKSSKYEDDVDY